jgi:hypothetical protein
MTPINFITGYIKAHEGVVSLRPDDAGNWYDPARYKAGLPFERGLGVLVGSKYGVTAYALVRYRLMGGMAPAVALIVTRSDIAAITFATAVDIGFKLFFIEPGFNKLIWNRVTASIVDKGWGSGPGTAKKMLQGLLGIRQDMVIGSITITDYAAWIGKVGEEAAARAWCAAREAKDYDIAHNEGPNDPDLKFLNGWNNRSESYLPGTVWWNAWDKAA